MPWPMSLLAPLCSGQSMQLHWRGPDQHSGDRYRHTGSSSLRESSQPFIIELAKLFKNIWLDKYILVSRSVGSQDRSLHLRNIACTVGLPLQAAI